MEPLDKISMGERIKQVRKKAGLRQWQLAELLGTTQSAVHKYEHGVIPEPRRLVELSRLGSTTIEWILTGRHWENGSESQQRPTAGVYRLAERLQSVGPEEQKVLNDALRILEQAIGAMRLSGGQELGSVDLAEKQKSILTAAVRVHRAVLEAALDIARQRLDLDFPFPTLPKAAQDPKRR